MTSPPLTTAMEAFPMPEGAIQLTPQSPQRSEREAVIQALQQALKERQLTLTLGPETALFDEQRLLSLNQFAIQLVTAGMVADEMTLNLAPWRTDGAAPQLCMAGLVDQENDVVAIQGVCTNQEIQELAQQHDRSASQLTLETTAFRGGLERLLTLVQLLEPAAIPRQALSTTMEQLRQRVIRISDWINGRVDDALAATGASLQPVSAEAFRAAQQEQPLGAKARLSIPLGLDGNQQIVSGDAVAGCIEQVQLELLPLDSGDGVSALLVRVSAALPGDLLPDGLVLTSQQGKTEQRVAAAGDLSIELTISGSGTAVDLALAYGDATPFVLPSLQIV